MKKQQTESKEATEQALAEERQRGQVRIEMKLM